MLAAFKRDQVVIRVKFNEFREKVNVKFSVDSSRYVIAKLEAAPEFSDAVFSIIRDKDEVTVVAKEGLELQSISEQKFFKLITFDVMLPFELTGFFAHISALLADKSIPVLVFSAYSTDHLFVREEDLDSAVEALEKDGMTRNGNNNS
jgi:hypothetical protein